VDFTARIWNIFVHLQFGENKNVEAILYFYVSLFCGFNDEANYKETYTRNLKAQKQTVTLKLQKKRGA
jgi:hypothetical protein